MSKPSIPPERLAPLIRALGDSSLPRLLVETLAGLVAAPHLSILAFDHELTARTVASESAGGLDLARVAGQVYEAAQFYRQDPAAAAVASGSSDGQPLLFRLTASDISDSRYRTQIYDEFGLVDRLSIIDQVGGRWYAVNLYRGREAGLFSDAEVTLVASLAPVISALVARHLTLASPSVWQAGPAVDRLERLVRALQPALTARQVQVCARAILGMTNTAIGLDLGVRPATVATLRQRAYATLDISSLNELFALCLVGSRGGEAAAVVASRGPQG